MTKIDNDDEDTRTCVRQGHDQVDTFIAHFSKPDASWETFGKGDFYLETLRLHLLEMLLCTERELQRRVAVEPTDLGV